MASTEDDVTLGELSRWLARFEKSITTEIRDLRTAFVPADVWAIEKRTMEDRMREQGSEIGELRGEIRQRDETKKAEHKELHDRIDVLKEDVAARDEQVRKERAQRFFAIGLASLGSLLSVIATVSAAIVLNSIGAG